jgi:diguanylate cyclase (GGDEF)-like protein
MRYLPTRPDFCATRFNCSYRRSFAGFLQNTLDQAQNYGGTFSVIMFDIDHFKAINDRYGHNTGDAILQAMASLVSENIRKSDMLARWGGEEFILSCPGAALPDAKALAEKLRLTIQTNPWDLGIAGTVTASFGVVERTAGEEDLAYILKRVDEKLYEAKRNRNTVAS